MRAHRRGSFTNRQAGWSLAPPPPETASQPRAAGEEWSGCSTCVITPLFKTQDDSPDCMDHFGRMKRSASMHMIYTFESSIKRRIVNGLHFCVFKALYSVYKVPNIHPFIHTFTAVSTMQGDNQFVERLRCLAQGHPNTQLGGGLN